MTTPPDDLEEKVNLLLGNIERRQRLTVYHAETKALKKRLSALELEVERYRVKESHEKEYKRPKIKENVLDIIDKIKENVLGGLDYRGDR